MTAPSAMIASPTDLVGTYVGSLPAFRNRMSDGTMMTAPISDTMKFNQAIRVA